MEFRSLSILVSLQSNLGTRIDIQPFRFQAMWLEEPNFCDVFSYFWAKNNNFVFSKIDRGAYRLLEWDKKSFWLYSQKKKNVAIQNLGYAKCCIVCLKSFSFGNSSLE